MIRRIAATMALVCVLAGCAEDGGSRGSGVFSEIGGNVATVSATTGVAGIGVSVAGTPIHTVTDTAGRFALRGAFDGPLRLVFQRSSDDLDAGLDLKVPAGATLTLTDVRVDTATTEASADEEAVRCEGILTGTYCEDALMKMVSAADTSHDPAEYTVRLDTSVVQDTHGDALSCDDLHSGQRAAVDALVDTNGAFSNGTITITAP